MERDADDCGAAVSGRDEVAQDLELYPAEMKPSRIAEMYLAEMKQRWNLSQFSKLQIFSAFG